ncbi:hypothetical protein AX17_001388 [Amanita inopinata Kibby_2008]|nr:hypothetical protein AX17_001388 [Amanita inopinata Kibby_2008]
MSVWSLARATHASPVAQGARRRTSSRFFVSTALRSGPAFAATPDVIDFASTSSSNASETVDAVRKQKLHDLRYSLSIIGNPSRVWSHYTNLLNYLGHEELPLEIHQQVLRKCTPSSAELRFAAARRLIVGNRPVTPHIHEGRFQTVVRAIRAMGAAPDLEDYHFILEQFAAVGHHVGVMHVYRELLFLGLEPKPKTFGLCFQAIAHRLTLPVLEVNHARLISQTKKMTADLLSDMQKYHVPFTSVNLDLCVRIMKETLDREGFDSLMKWGYGIDLSNPDRAPLEYMDIGDGDRKVKLGQQNIDIPTLPAPLPFSTAALNTTIDMLGRFGGVSKLVQAFEVLTQPLPQASQHFFSSFDDDDFGVSVPASPPFTPPYAKPNTTTFSMLIRHLCRAGHAILARHYLLQVMDLDKLSKVNLRAAVTSKSLDKVTAPRIAINRGTLLPVFGTSNRDKNVGLMRWLNTKLPRIIRKKRAELIYFNEFHERLIHAKEQRDNQEFLHSTNTDTSSMNNRTPPASSDVPKMNTKVDVSVPDNPSKASAFLPSNLLRRIRPQNLSSRVRWDPAKVGSAFDVDINQEPATSSSPQSASPSHDKPFSLGLHIQILERDLREIEELASRVEDVLGRTIQRVKERLGRRIWAGRDIYLRTEDRRLKVSRTQWTAMANFQPRRRYSPDEGDVILPCRTRKLDPGLKLYRQPIPNTRHYGSLAYASAHQDRLTTALESMSLDPVNTQRDTDGSLFWNYLCAYLRWR